MSVETPLKPFLSEIANAIRQKKETSTPINAKNFASEILSIQGSGGGSSDLIDVTELPTTVDDSKIYRVKDSIKANAYICYNASVFDLATALSDKVGESAQLNYIIVDKLPQTGTEVNGNVIDAYILTTNNTGYLWDDGWSDFASIANSLEENANFQNKGSIDSVNNIKEDGIYIVYTRPIEIGVPNENNDKTVSFWNGKSWGYGNKVVELDGENLPDVGVEGTIYFRKNVPCLMHKGYSAISFISALGDTNLLGWYEIVYDVPTTIKYIDAVTIVVQFLPVGNGKYNVYTVSGSSISELPNIGQSPSEDNYIKMIDEVWYFTCGRYMKLTYDFDVSDGFINVGTFGCGYHYTGNLYAVDVDNKRDILFKNISGIIEAKYFEFDPFFESGKYAIETGALAGCKGVTGVDSFYLEGDLRESKIGDAAFYGCTGITTINIAAGDGIGKHAFYGCTNLQSVYIYYPNIGEYAFANCTSLKDIYFNSSKAEWNAGTFGRGWNENTGNYTVHCTDGDIVKS